LDVHVQQILLRVVARSHATALLILGDAKFWLAAWA
jgi:hypothetical protein